MSCDYCDKIEGKSPKIYEDGETVAFLADAPATIGHVIVAPKKHTPIFEMLGDSYIEKIFSVANKVSISLFEAIKCEGTNLIINNGIGQDAPHFSINLIARRPEDGLSFEWKGRQLSEEEMSTIELQMKEELNRNDTEQPKIPINEEINADAAKKKESAENNNEKKEDKKEENKSPKEEEENYLIRQLRRMP